MFSGIIKERNWVREHRREKQHLFRENVLLDDFLIIIIIIISLMQGIYTHIPETNYVPRGYRVAAILLFLFTVLISLVSVLNLLYFYISTFRSMCAVPNMAVLCSSLTSWFPGMLLTYFLNDSEVFFFLLLNSKNIYNFSTVTLFFQSFNCNLILK